MFALRICPDGLQFALALIAVVAVPGCREESSAARTEAASIQSAGASSSEGIPSGGVLRLASTTSTRDSGLFDVLLPAFETKHQCRVDVIAVGTGAALKLGERGDVDAVLVHARAAEEAFMKAGHGMRHEPVMHNSFIIVGPVDDPAGAAGFPSGEAMQLIAAGEHLFVSRGDDSGTHKKELAIWRSTGGRPEWDGYLETGQGMGPSLVIADEKNAYVLTDEGTWLRRRKSFRLRAVVSGSEELRNPYSVIVVNSERHSAVNADLADTFTDFLIAEKTQRLIAGYRVNGRQLFHPDRLPVGSDE